MSTPIDNRALVWAFNQSTYTIPGLAALLDIGTDTLQELLRGTPRPEGVRLSTLLALTDKLGVPLHVLFPAPTDPPDLDNPSPGAGEAARDAPTLVADAEQLVACIYTNGRTPTTSTDLTTAFGWTLDRLDAAADEATRRLAPAGLKLTRSHGEYIVVPTRNHQDAKTRLDDRHASERGLTHSHYKAVYQILQRQPVTVSNSVKHRQGLLGGLANHCIVSDKSDPELSPDTIEGFI